MAKTSAPLPRRFLPLLVLYILGSARFTDLERFINSLSTRVFELNKYFSETYDPRSLSHKLRNDLDALVAYKYVIRSGDVFEITEKGMWIVEEKVLPLISPEIVKEIDRAARRPKDGRTRTLRELLREMGIETPVSPRAPLGPEEVKRLATAVLDMVVSDEASRLASSLELCKSAYCAAIKISSLYSYLSSLVKDLGVEQEPGDLLARILNDYRVVEAASKISDIILLPYLASNDVRFKSLRPVADILENWIRYVAKEQRRTAKSQAGKEKEQTRTTSARKQEIQQPSTTPVHISIKMPQQAQVASAREERHREPRPQELRVQPVTNKQPSSGENKPKSWSNLISDFLLAVALLALILIAIHFLFFSSSTGATNAPTTITSTHTSSRLGQALIVTPQGGSYSTPAISVVMLSYRTISQSMSITTRERNHNHYSRILNSS